MAKPGYNQKKNVYTQQYIRDNYRQLSIRLQKDGDVTREKIAEAAEREGMSANAYIIDAVQVRMDYPGLRFPQEQKDLIHETAARHGMSASGFIREAVETKLRENGAMIPQDENAGGEALQNTGNAVK